MNTVSPVHRENLNESGHVFMIPCRIFPVIIIAVIAGCGNRLLLRESRYPDGHLKEQYHIRVDKQGNDIREGPFVFYHFGNGVKQSEGWYKNDMLEGLRVCWYEKGQKQSEKTYRDGKAYGQYSYWYENGQKESEWNYRNGMLDGPFVRWYENGQKRLAGAFLAGRQHGALTRWCENGQKQAEENYDNALEQGLFRFWYENGEKQSDLQ